MASGSALTSGMVICPCSGGTLSAVAHGASTNLIQRAADVHLKERRKLILVPRETPLSLIHLDNMKRACEAGAIVLPASPGWYHGVQSVRDLVDFIVARILDHLDVAHELSGRWGSGRSSRNADMWTRLRHLLEMIRFSHTVFALPFALLAAVMAWSDSHGPRDSRFRFAGATCWAF